MNGARLTLKQPTGWFAAGREVAQAITSLSDAAFKMYLYLCLQADRHTARLTFDPAEVAKALGKDLAWIEGCFSELRRNQVCERRGERIEISDRFWPYQKLPDVTAAATKGEFVRQVRTAFLKRACVHSTFTAADEKVALNLYRRQVSLEQVCRAIWLGCAPKYVAMLNGQTCQPVTSLAYFASLIEEVSQPRIPASYWDHVRRRAEQIEKRWLGTANQPSAAPCAPETSTEML